MPTDSANRSSVWMREQLLGVPAEAVSMTGRATSECFDLLECVFASSTNGFRYRIIPIDEHDDNISVGLGIEWRDLLPLLTKLGLLASHAALLGSVGNMAAVGACGGGGARGAAVRVWTSSLTVGVMMEI